MSFLDSLPTGTHLRFVGVNTARRGGNILCIKPSGDVAWLAVHYGDTLDAELPLQPRSADILAFILSGAYHLLKIETRGGAR